jgi:multiple sugar transport system substrate-binding protein
MNQKILGGQLFMKKLLLLILLLLMVVLITSACSGGNNETAPTDSPSATEKPTDSDPKLEPEPATFSNDPVTISVFGNGNHSLEKFERELQQPIAEGLPHITLEFVKSPVEGVNDADIVDALSELVTTGNIPDMLYGADFNAVNFGLVTDLNPLVKKYNIDLSMINPALINENQMLSPGDELYSLPFKGNHPVALYYNKDIFERLGIEYPKDGLFYDEYAELVGRISRFEDGVNYRGGTLDTVNRMTSQFSAEYVDSETFEPVFLTDPKWKVFADFWKSFNEIPNNNLVEDGGTGGFVESQTIAMIPYGAGFSNRVHKASQETGMQWDIAAYPTFREYPGIAPFNAGNGMAITPNSKNQDAAFQIMHYLAYDEKSQLEGVRVGNASVLDIPLMKENFGSEMESLKGKRREVIYFNPHEGARGTSLYGGKGPTIAWQAMMLPIRNEGMDVIEALRLADDALRQDIAIQMEARPAK